ncbi:MAG: S26 family signal peptidase [bacterium]|nr:S26 family signal peptidase [bacterium]
MNNVIKALLVLLVLFLVYKFVANPTQIEGGNPGLYKNGQEVLVISKYALFRQIHPGDVVTFSYKPELSSIAEVSAVAGDRVSEKTYYMSNEELKEEFVPLGFVLVRFDQKSHLRAIPAVQITGLVWYSFK